MTDIVRIGVRMRRQNLFDPGRQPDGPASGLHRTDAGDAARWLMSRAGVYLRTDGLSLLFLKGAAFRHLPRSCRARGSQLMNHHARRRRGDL